MSYVSKPQPAARIRLARKLLADGLPRVARQVLAQHLELVPHDIVGWMLASYALGLDGDAREAARAAAQAANVFPGEPSNNPALAAMLAKCLVRVELVARARTLISPIESEDVRDPQACQELARVCAQLGELAQALTWWRRACALSPDAPAIRFGLVNALEHAEAWQEAGEHVRWLCDRFPERAEPRQLLARIQHRMAG